MTRDRFAHYRDLMAAHGFRPSRARGQNFLLDPSLHRAIAEAAELEGDAVALEIGTGLGFLTRELATRAASVVTVEIDDRLAAIVADEVETWERGERVELVRCDALDGDRIAPPVIDAVRHASAAGRAPITIVANLSYAVAGRFLAIAMTQSTIPIRRIVAVVQLELAERLAAAPGTAEYGGLTVLAGAFGSVELVRRIGREVFRPRPRVDSALVRITARQPAAALPPGFAKFVRLAFQSRRKTLRHAIRAWCDSRDGGGGGTPSAATLDRFGGRRADALSATEFLELFAELPVRGTDEESRMR